MKKDNFILKIPKAELHLHIEGTLEPELMFKIAKRNSIKIKYKSIKELKNAYKFNNLQDFLDIYYQCTNVLINKKDFYDLTLEYFKKVHKQNVLHAEIFFDPQTHTNRGIKFKTVINGISKAQKYAYKKFKISSKLIMCFLRDQSVDSAMETLKEALKYKNMICAVGLDSAEVGNPPSKFKEVFNIARKNGFLTVAHAGEEGTSKYVWQAINQLKVSRIDHGNHTIDDPKLIKELVKRKIPLTLCPLSNLRLKIIKDIKNHPIRNMINQGLFVTINSDDPAYFFGYINDNYLAIEKAVNLKKEEIYNIAKNSFNASFLSKKEKQKLINKLDKYVQSFHLKNFN